VIPDAYMGTILQDVRGGSLKLLAIDKRPSGAVLITQHIPSILIAERCVMQRDELIFHEHDIARSGTANAHLGLL
jgi:hypothetical protein